MRGAISIAGTYHVAGFAQRGSLASRVASYATIRVLHNTSSFPRCESGKRRGGIRQEYGKWLRLTWVMLAVGRGCYVQGLMRRRGVCWLR